MLTIFNSKIKIRSAVWFITLPIKRERRAVGFRVKVKAVDTSDLVTDLGGGGNDEFLFVLLEVGRVIVDVE